MLGIDHEDDDRAAQSAYRSYQLPYPSLKDHDGDLAHALGLSAVPATLFINKLGRIVYLYNSTALDYKHLQGLAKDHLHV